MRVKQPKAAEPDPELLRQQEAARTEKVGAIQDRVGAVTDQLVRLYGSRASLSGASGLRAPIFGFRR